MLNQRTTQFSLHGQNQTGVKPSTYSQAVSGYVKCHLSNFTGAIQVIQAFKTEF